MTDTRVHHDVVYAVRRLEPAEADRLRAVGGPVYEADTSPGFPCRQCLRDAAVGDELILVSYDPFDTTSPYRSAGPIFIHRTPCAPYAETASLPPQLTGRMLSVRAFDDLAMMRDGVVVDGTALESTVQRMFADIDVTHLHVHNAARGCFAARIDRTPG